MHLLVDGHNLIGQIPGLSLADADDEARLVLLLRRYATRKRGTRVVVVFDHGVYGHPDRLDGYGVTCHFARSPQDADAQLIRRIAALTRPREWGLVSSDRQVARAAADRGLRVIGAREFANQLLEPVAKPKIAPEEKYDVRLSPAEVEEWLRLFGEPVEPVEEAPAPEPKVEPPKSERRKGRRSKRR